jgi:ABC-type antimicrobial peptide transport system permease subunit
MATRLWPGKDPIGQRVALSVEALVFDRDGPPHFDFPHAFRTVIGVVGNVHHNSLSGPAPPEMWVPYAQRPTRDLSIVIRSAGDASALGPALRSALRQLDPDQPLGSVSTMQDRLGASLAPPRSQAGLVGFFGLTALLLAVVGVYGVLATLVSDRQREIGLRLALGATSGRVEASVLSQGARLIAIGTVLGLAGGFAGGRLLSRLLYGITPGDPLTFAVVPLFLALVGLAACWVPARRAARVDPMSALRGE